MRVQGKQLIDDTGVYFALGYTDFQAVRNCAFDQPFFRDRARYLRSLGYHFARCLGSVAWAGLEILPTSPWYWEAMLATVDQHAEYGLRTQWSFGDWDTPLLRAVNLEAFYEDFAERMKSRRDHLQSVEIVNEYFNQWDGGGNWPNGEAGVERLRAIGRTVKGILGVPVILSAPKIDSPAMLKDLISGVNLTAVHLERNIATWEGNYRPPRQARGPQEADVAWWDQEPAGPESSGSDYRDPELLLASRVAAVICDAAGTIYHSRAGTGNRGKRDIRRSPGVAECAQILKLLPTDIGTWEFRNHTHPAHPFMIDAVGDQMGTLDGSKDGCVRAFSKAKAQCYIVQALGVPRRSLWTPRRKMSMRIIDPITQEEIFARTVGSDQSVLVPQGKHWVVYAETV